jgi:sialate O-acetylesterase
MHRTRSMLSLVVACGFAAAAPAPAAVTLPNVLSSHMVLQRDTAVPIWGTAAPDEKVTVRFRDQEKATTAAADGTWQVALDPLTAGGPDTLTVVGTNTLTLDDVLVGEVWVGSGQSNMAGNVAGYAKNDKELAKLSAAAPYPTIRQVNGNGKWVETTAANVGTHSAILFAFGAKLQLELGVPVGLMLGAVGGTPSGFWLSSAALADDPGVQAAIAKASATYDPAAEKARYETALAKWEEAVEKAKAEKQKGPKKPEPPLAPGACRGKVGHLYDARIRPMVPFAVRGVLWDQGESGTAVAAVDQFTLMGALIKGWRKEWGRDLPFIIVQKPSGGGCAYDPADPVTSSAEQFAPLPPAVPVDGDNRDLHIRIKEHPKTFLAIASDLGAGIHPGNKFGYGSRAARVALGAVYGKPVEIYGPTVKAVTADGGTVRVTFDHVGAGLTPRHADKVQGFAVAGADGTFAWADAVIDGDAVVLSCAKVPAPVTVRYGYASRLPWANLFNKDGLPAVSFTANVAESAAAAPR